MDILNIVNAIVLMVGLPALFKVCFDVGKKLQILDTLERVTHEQMEDIRELRKESSEIKSKVNVLWDWFSRHIVLDPQGK